MNEVTPRAVLGERILGNRMVDALPVPDATTQMLVQLLCLVPGSRPGLTRNPAATWSLQVRQQTVAEIARAQNLPVRLLATGPLFDDVYLVKGRRHDFIVAPMAADPLYQDPDGFPVNRGVLERLRRIRHSGLEFDDLCVVHEVPQGSVGLEAGDVHRAIMPPPPEKVRQLSRDLGCVATGLWTIAALPLAAAALLGGVIAAGGALAAIGVAGGVTAGYAGFDPLLLGGVVGQDRPVRTGEPAAWYYLGHWVYNAEE